MGILYNLVVVLGLFFGSESDFQNLNETQKITMINQGSYQMQGVLDDHDGL